MDQNPDQPPTTPQFRINEQLVQSRLEAMKMDENLPLGIIGGAIGGVIGAALWAAITYFSEYQIGWMSIGVGFLVGYGVALLGKGMSPIFGVIGGVISLVAVMVGNFLVVIGFLAKVYGLPFLEALLAFDYSMTGELMVETFQLIDLLFYALAIYTGYRYSFRKVSREKLLEGAIIEVK